MRATVAIVLPPGATPAARAVVPRVLAWARHAVRFDPVLIGTERDAPCDDLAYRMATPRWFAGNAVRRHAAGVGRVLEDLRPAVIEVHDQPAATLLLARRFRPVPVVLVMHNDPQAMRGARDAPERTYLLAHATRAATLSEALRDRLLQGVHQAMRRCVVLPEGPEAAAALDALREDALDAWSRTLNLPI